MKRVSGIFLILLFALCSDASVLMNSTFGKGRGGWQIPSYWAGKLSIVRVDNGKVMRLESGVMKSKTYARAFSISLKQGIGQFKGTPMRLTVNARGQGKLLAGLLVYRPHNPRPQYLPGKAVALGGEFRRINYDVVIPFRAFKIAPYVEIKGKGSAEIKNIRLESRPSAEISVEAVSRMQVVKPSSDIAPVEFRVTPADTPLEFCQRLHKKSRERRVVPDSSGKIIIQPEKLGGGLCEISASAGGKVALNYISVEKPADYDRSNALAKQIRFERPVSILILGDSLSDFFRGYNYVDRLEFWLNKYNPGKVSICNAGVRGDFVRRMEYRLYDTHRGEKVSFQPDAYRGIFDRKYDYIFIFIGQNDTRTSKRQNFAVPLTDAATQIDGLNKIIKYLRSRSEAKIVLISPSPSYEAGFKERVAKLKPGKNIFIFGKKEFVDQYDRINRRICQEYGLDYIDILTPMRKAKNLRSFFNSDFVHLSPAGGRFIADEVLKYFVGK